MLAPLQGWLDREVMGVFRVATAMASGVAVSIDNSQNTGPLNPSPYSNSFGFAVAATIASASAGSKELGYVLQPVTTNGPALLSILSQVYDESVPANATTAILPPKQGALIGTDQYVTGAGTGAIKFDGTVALGALCGINAGLVRVKQAADEPRLQFMGKVVQRLLPLATFQIV